MGSDGLAQALVAQRIRASDYGSEGREFESLQARFNCPRWAVFFWLIGRADRFGFLRLVKALLTFHGPGLWTRHRR